MSHIFRFSKIFESSRVVFSIYHILFLTVLVHVLSVDSLGLGVHTFIVISRELSIFSFVFTFCCLALALNNLIRKNLRVVPLALSEVVDPGFIVLNSLVLVLVVLPDSWDFLHVICFKLKFSELSLLVSLECSLHISEKVSLGIIRVSLVNDEGTIVESVLHSLLE